MESDCVYATNITLQDARDAIAGRNEFREHDMGDHYVIRFDSHFTFDLCVGHANNTHYTAITWGRAWMTTCSLTLQLHLMQQHDAFGSLDASVEVFTRIFCCSHLLPIADCVLHERSRV